MEVDHLVLRVRRLVPSVDLFFFSSPVSPEGIHVAGQPGQGAEPFSFPRRVCLHLYPRFYAAFISYSSFRSKFFFTFRRPRCSRRFTLFALLLPLLPVALPHALWYHGKGGDDDIRTVRYSSSHALCEYTVLVSR